MGSAHPKQGLASFVSALIGRFSGAYQATGSKGTSLPLRGLQNSWHTACARPATRCVARMKSISVGCERWC